MQMPNIILISSGFKLECISGSSATWIRNSSMCAVRWLCVIFLDILSMIVGYNVATDNGTSRLQINSAWMQPRDGPSQAPPMPAMNARTISSPNPFWIASDFMVAKGMSLTKMSYMHRATSDLFSPVDDGGSRKLLLTI